MTVQAEQVKDPWEGAFLQNMIRARRKASWSQAELAHHLREGGGLAFHQQTVQRVEKGQRPLRLNEAIVIAITLKMGDLTLAATPDTAEGARSALHTSVSIAQNEQVRLQRQLDQLDRGIRDIHDWLRLELKTYKKTARTDEDDPEVRQASDLLDQGDALRRWFDRISNTLQGRRSEDG